MKKVWLLVASMCIVPVVLAHSGGDMDVFVRTASVDSGQYAFTCATDPASDTVRDWFIRAESEEGEREEASFQDVPADEPVNYTFQTNSFYHVGCIVVENGQVQGRGDLHIDLRSTTWNPDIEAVSSDNLTATYRCITDTNATPSWSVLNAETGAVTQLGSANPLTHTVDEPGLYDYSCRTDAGTRTLPVEYFTDHSPYLGDAEGVPVGVTHAWNRSVRTTDNPAETTNASSGDNKSVHASNDNETEPGRDVRNLTMERNDGTVTYTCNPTNSSDDLAVDWNYGDGTTQEDAAATTRHTYRSNGTYLVQCDVWDNLNAQFTTVQRFFNITGATVENTTHNETDDDTTTEPAVNRNATNQTGLSVTDEDGLSVTFTCNPVNSSDDLAVDWRYGDGSGANDIDPVQRHTYANSGTYRVQCDAWDSANAAFTSLQHVINVSSETPACADANCTGGDACPNGTCKEQISCTADEDCGTGGTCRDGICMAEENRTDTTGLSVSEQNGLETTFKCNPANSSDDLAVDWNYGDGAGQNDVDDITTHSYGSAGTYFVRCSAWDNAKAEYTSLQRYVDVSANDSPLAAPDYIEPSDGLTGVAPEYFHLNVKQPSYEVESSDWEVWNDNRTERVWAAVNNTDLITYHTHTPDGNFTQANTSRLEYRTTYQVRVRFNTENGSSSWAEWRTFTTKPAPTLNASEPTWTVPEGFGVERFATGFDVPVHVAKAPSIYDDQPENTQPFLYVTELYGTVKVVYRDGSHEVYADNILNFDPFGSITGGGQMGTVSLYVDDAGDLFVGTVYQDSDNFYNKVIKYRSTEDGSGYTNSTVILDGVPSGPSHQIQQITEGPDGNLYVNFGEGLTPANAQNNSNFAGSIMRMKKNGSDTEIYAKGFRNPFGADWRPGSDQLFATDNAPDTDDRLVQVKHGKNYGWGLDDNMETFLDERIATLGVSPVDVEFNNGTFPELTGRLYVAVGGQIYQEGPVDDAKHVQEFTLDQQGNVAGQRTFLKYSGDGYGTPIGLEFAEGGLYVTDIYGEPGFVGLGQTEGNIYRVAKGNATVCDNCTTGSFRAGISVKPWYPKDTGDGIAYVFRCKGIDGTEPYRYRFDRGTGTFSTGSDSIYIEYPYGDVNRTLRCNAEDATGGVASASITVNPSDFISG